MIEYIFVCEYCGKLIDGSYVDRQMMFCNPTCALKQAEEKFKNYNSRREFPSGDNGTHKLLGKSNSVVEASRRDIPSQMKGHVRWRVEKE